MRCAPTHICAHRQILRTHRQAHARACLARSACSAAASGTAAGSARSLCWSVRLPLEPLPSPRRRGLSMESVVCLVGRGRFSTKVLSDTVSVGRVLSYEVAASQSEY